MKSHAMFLREGAILPDRSAAVHALGGLAKRFDAAKLDSVGIVTYPGFCVAKVKVQARQIQKLRFVDSASGTPLHLARAT